MEPLQGTPDFMESKGRFSLTELLAKMDGWKVHVIVLDMLYLLSPGIQGALDVSESQFYHLLSI